ncbi:MRPS27/PTCD2 [Cinara cedri]|uniref:MRPS27/PTCD2 n=1 Tax=Cinara cedri TaxID=506608 RepID=A0A5E4MVA0_9HEMI|nr:MRPS27/PTCD2 [Cinara cedri]
MFTLKKSLFPPVVRRLCMVRSFLTDAYRCNEVWQERLNCSVLKKVNPEELYYKLSSMLDNGSKQINAVDLDIFVNSLTDNSFLDELEDLTHKFRLSAQAGTLLPSTHHAFIRLFLESGKINDLIKILKNRLDYGIFPDYYLCNLLMDKFLKENNFRNAAVIASNQMLQEELDNDITKNIGLYSCLKYITNPTDWEDTIISKEEEKENTGSDDEDEVKRVRVNFIRNPYFDDHFDLTDGDHLVGKTMLAISKTDNTMLSNSFKAIGLAYFNRWNELESYLEKFVGTVHSEAVDLSVASIDKRAPENAEKLKNAFAKIEIDNKSLTEETKNAVNEAVEKNEKNEIKLQQKIYKDWESFRRDELQRYMKYLDKLKRLQKVQQVKQELKDKEQLLFFFDNEHKYDLIKEEKLKKMKKPKVISKGPKDDLTYIPPEIKHPGFKHS